MGLFEFVFGKSAPKDDTAPKQSYYLSDDDAKSFGNIDYMRSTKVVRRTFAKKKGQTEHMESVRSISATKMTDLDGNPSSAPVSAPTTFGTTDFLGDKKQSEPEAAEPAPSDSVPKAERPKANVDSSMDMFRNMAKDIRR
ncbi:MAG: hypothetical protein ABG776_00140 [Cyanobacteria bacterium J06555_13]